MVSNNSNKNNNNSNNNNPNNNHNNNSSLNERKLGSEWYNNHRGLASVSGPLLRLVPAFCWLPQWITGPACLFPLLPTVDFDLVDSTLLCPTFTLQIIYCWWLLLNYEIYATVFLLLCEMNSIFIQLHFNATPWPLIMTQEMIRRFALIELLLYADLMKVHSLRSLRSDSPFVCGSATRGLLTERGPEIWASNLTEFDSISLKEHRLLLQISWELNKKMSKSTIASQFHVPCAAAVGEKMMCQPSKWMNARKLLCHSSQGLGCDGIVHAIMWIPKRSFWYDWRVYSSKTKTKKIKNKIRKTQNEKKNPKATFPIIDSVSDTLLRHLIINYTVKIPHRDFDIIKSNYRL